MHLIIFGKADVFVLVEIFNHLIECGTQTIGGIAAALG
jgi:hypothetical protein